MPFRVLFLRTRRLILPPPYQGMSAYLCSSWQRSSHFGQRGFHSLRYIGKNSVSPMHSTYFLPSSPRRQPGRNGFTDVLRLPLRTGLKKVRQSLIGHFCVHADLYSHHPIKVCPPTSVLHGSVAPISGRGASIRYAT